jgi:hypothetical protein
MPPSFWYDADLQAALASRHMGTVIKAYRHHPHHGRRGITQDEVAAWAGTSQGQLSRTESGPAIDRIARLTFWAQAAAHPRGALVVRAV